MIFRTQVGLLLPIVAAAVFIAAANVALVTLPGGRATKAREAAVDVRYVGYTLLLAVIVYAGANTACPLFLVAHVGRQVVLGRWFGLGYIEWPYTREEILSWRVG